MRPRLVASPWLAGSRSSLILLAAFSLLFAAHIPATAIDWLFTLLATLIVILCAGFAGWSRLLHAVRHSGAGWSREAWGRDPLITWALCMGVVFARADMVWHWTQPLLALPWMMGAVPASGLALLVTRRQVQSRPAAVGGP